MSHQMPPVVALDDPTAFADQEQLWLAVNRYTPETPRTGGYTVLLTHGASPRRLVHGCHAHEHPAGGFYKESFEVLLASLLASPQGERIDEIWSLDCATNGDSGVRTHHFDWSGV
jgi:hypothetical protein